MKPRVMITLGFLLYRKMVSIKQKTFARKKYKKQPFIIVMCFIKVLRILNIGYKQVYR